MNYSIDYENDTQRQWEDAMESAQDHLERLLCDLVTAIPKLSESAPYPNCTADWYLEMGYLRKLEEAKSVATLISTGDAFGYAERYIGEPDYEID